MHAAGRSPTSLQGLRFEPPVPQDCGPVWLGIEKTWFNISRCAAERPRSCCPGDSAWSYTQADMRALRHASACQDVLICLRCSQDNEDNRSRSTQQHVVGLCVCVCGIQLQLQYKLSHKILLHRKIGYICAYAVTAVDFASTKDN